MTAVQLENLGSLITYHQDGHSVCLGYLMGFHDKGVFDASLGKVDVSPADADTHNKLLDEAMLKGLDDNCQIGQGGSFYATETEGNMGPGVPKVRGYVIKTWLGTLVSEAVTWSGSIRKTLTFRRAGKKYRGVLQKDADCFNFKRIA